MSMRIFLKIVIKVYIQYSVSTIKILLLPILRTAIIIPFAITKKILRIMIVLRISM